MTKYYRETGKLTPLNKESDGLGAAMVSSLSPAVLFDIDHELMIRGMNDTPKQLRWYMDDNAADHLDGEPFHYRDGILYSVEATKCEFFVTAAYKYANGVISYDAMTTDEAHEPYEKDIWEVLDGD